MANKINILLVEDSRSAIELAQHAFTLNDYSGNLAVARDGEEALDLILNRNGSSDDQTAAPDLILLDLKMPKVGGLEVLEQIRANEHLRSTLVVVLTASADRHDVKQAYDLGANSYLVKPVDFDEFVAMIGQVIDYWCKLNQQPAVSAMA